MYLVEQDCSKGVDILLERFEQTLRARPNDTPIRQGFAGRPFASVVSEVVKQQRPALLFGEPTLSWVYHFSVGFDLAFEEVDGEAAEADRKQMTLFSKWLAQRYGWTKVVPWHRLLRVYEGEHLPGLVAFVRLWDEFVASRAKEQ